MPVADRDSMLVMLQEGRGDVVAAQLTTDGWTAPSRTGPSLIALWLAMYARPRTARPGSATRGSADTLAVSAWSPFLDSLQLSTAVDSGVVLHIVDQLPEELLARSAMGKVPVVLVSDATTWRRNACPWWSSAHAWEKSVPLVFAVRTNADHLLHALTLTGRASSARHARRS
ncbi:MAG: hypothetical protein IPH00_15840 [Flavobacteriales bacterium]|nr:hypothetical protein [Flavobacteriales bacterium]